MELAATIFLLVLTQQKILHFWDKVLLMNNMQSVQANSIKSKFFTLKETLLVEYHLPQQLLQPNILTYISWQKNHDSKGKEKKVVWYQKLSVQSIALEEKFRIEEELLFWGI